MKKKLLVILLGLVFFIGGCTPTIPETLTIPDAMKRVQQYDGVVVVTIEGYFNRATELLDYDFVIRDFVHPVQVSLENSNGGFSAFVKLKKGITLDDLKDLKKGDLIKVRGIVPERGLRTGSVYWLDMYDAEIIK